MTTTTIKGAAGEARVLRADARRNHTKVLLSARKLFAEQGLDAQIDEIARDAGVGVGTVYRHFPTKEDLLQALADERFIGLAEAAQAALEVEDPGQGFVEFMTYSARVMTEDRALSEAMDQLPGLCRMAAERVEMLRLTGEVLARAQASGDIREDIVPEDIPALICGLGRAVRSEVERPTMSWQRYLEIMLAGMRA
ncbi:MAG: TetR/AcrR family transcriptional regulator [Solirubrobacterales bacterium]|jgi:AcrR family transcriptional regulator|nr:TetR/AcrR family transcriptional regulator [Solirubrobacterales bacterium]